MAVGIGEVRAAGDRLAGVAVRTPLLESPALNEALGFRLLAKAEALQRTGSFKFRGAYNAIAQTEADTVVAYSSGNHAQGVAHAAALLGRRAIVVMPADAPAIKIANTRGYGAEVRLYDRYREVREAIGARVSEETGAALIKPYDDPRVIAGQGTAGLEIAEDAPACLDRAIVCCGGGGLTAGCAVALADALPGLSIHTAEPEGFDDTARSLASGGRETASPGARSVCDALLATAPGEITLPINRALVASGLVVTDEEALAAMRVAFERLKVVVEPGGAVALAAAIKHHDALAGETVAVTLSGGNVDPATFARCLA